MRQNILVNQKRDGRYFDNRVKYKKNKVRLKGVFKMM